MENLAIVSLVGNIVQFVDFTGELVGKSVELYRSSEGTLAEHADAELATNHLKLLSNKLKDASTIAGDCVLKSLCESCQVTAEELLAALNKVKVNGKQGRWKSSRKALQSVWNKEKIHALEDRLAKFREELNLHVTVELRYEYILLSNICANRQCGAVSKSHDLRQITQTASIISVWPHERYLTLLLSNRTCLRRTTIGRLLKWRSQRER